MELLAGLGFTIIDADGEMLATAVREPYASEIANAINLHDELVAFVTTLENRIRCGSLWDIIKDANAILKRCQKEKRYG
jgi:hypothetical protein